MRTISKDVIIELEIKKSKFLAYARKVISDKDAEEILDALREKHKTATHVTYAYILHSPAKEKCSDDGEPSGTAGKPILDILKKNDLTNILVVVVRYFGGIKLGAGGLVRAYSNSAKNAVDEAEIVELKNYIVAEIMVNFDNKYIIDNDKEINIIEVDYSRISDKLVKYKIAMINEISRIDRIKGISRSYKELEQKLM